MHITKVHIQNFKSIKNLEFDARRVNVFIGEPNTGKTNIIEALSVFSINASSAELFKHFVRFKSTRNLFYDSVLDRPLYVKTNLRNFKVEYQKTYNRFGAVYYTDEEEQFLKEYDKNLSSDRLSNFSLEHDGRITLSHSPTITTFVKAFVYKRLTSFNQSFRSFLNPPFGDNIPNLLISNSDLKKMVSNFFKDKGYKIILKPEDNDIEIAKEEDEVLYSYPYVTISETLQRIVFMMLAIETCRDSTLLFDEPESNTFPFYTKYIAERIAQDKTNQYFLTSHNPYLLLNIIEKTPSKELSVFVTTMKNYQTKIHLLTPRQLKEVIRLQHDVFLNLDKFSK
ncbi:MAG: AAA family ATPase [Bacteroidetes bacterium]|nr:AAA family ATPase [Bacteroidota bacterium]